MRTYSQILSFILATALAIAMENAASAISDETSSTLAENGLSNLAMDHFRGDILPAENKLFEAAGSGKVANCQGGPFESRLIRADRLAWLCGNGKAAALVTQRGIIISGATVQGIVDLEWAIVAFPLEISQCVFTGSIIIRNSTFVTLSLSGTAIQNLDASGIIVRKNVFLGNGFKAHGEVQFSGARIDGDLDCHGGQFTDGKGDAPAAFDSPAVDAKALDANGAKIQGSIFLGKDFKALGTVDLTAATIGGDLNCGEGQFLNSGGVALTAYSARIGGSLSLSHFAAQGEVQLGRAQIGKGLDCNGGQFVNNGKFALNAESMNVQASALLNNGFMAQGEVNLQHVVVGTGLYCDNGRFFDSEDLALDAESAQIGSGGVLLSSSFTADRGVRFAGAKIDGDLNCDNGQFVNIGDAPALDVKNAKIQGSVFLRQDFKALGKVDLTGAAIGGNLDCSGGQFLNDRGLALTVYSTKISGNVCLMQGFTAQGIVELRLAEIGKGLDCSRGYFTNGGLLVLNAEAMSVRDSVLLNRGFIAEGAVNLRHVVVGIGLYCDDGQFSGTEDLALNAEFAHIGGGGAILTGGFTAEGGVRFAGAKIEGDLDCRKGNFRSSQSFAIEANSASIGGSALFGGEFCAHGGIDLKHAIISGNLNCDGGQFFGDKANQIAIDADSVGIDGTVSLCRGFFAEGTVTFKDGRVGRDFELKNRKINQSDTTILDLQFTRVGVLYNEEKSWPKPGNLRLRGFVYGAIRSDAEMPNATTQVHWIQTQKVDFMPQPYEQLAATLRAMGNQDQAVQVMIDENEQAGRDAIAKDQGLKLLWDWCWYKFFGWIIGYGYRPWNALYLSFGFVLLGTVVFKIGYDKQIVIPTDDRAWVNSGGAEQLSETYPKFNAFIYSLETFVPLVKLAVGDHWIPNANRGAKLFRVRRFELATGSLFRCYLWIHILAGWILTTLWVGAFTGLLKT
jgi:hypothetical protein